jgi:hypothetical protein
MKHRSAAWFAVVALLATIVAACNGGSSTATLTDPTEIVTAAITSTQAAKSVHLEIAIDGTATVALPIGGGGGTAVDLTGTTASADLDLGGGALRATFAAPSLLGLAGEVIAVDGTTYLKTTLTGPLYQASSASSGPVDPSAPTGMINGLGNLLLGDGVQLTKGDDVACGSATCYTVSTTLTAADLGTSGADVLGGLPIDLTGASLALTIRVEQAPPNHLAGVQAVATMADGTSITIDVTASKWDEPVTITAPPADQVKPAG